MSQYLLYLEKEAGKFVKNVILKEIQKILKKPFVALDMVFNFLNNF